MEIIYLYLMVTWLMGIGVAVGYNSECETRAQKVAVGLVLFIFAPIIVPIKIGAILSQA